MRRKLTLPLGALLLTFAAGCGGNAPSAETPEPTPLAQEDRKLSTDDYRYVYQPSCFCVFSGEVEVEVRDGEAVSAEVLGGEKLDPMPMYLSKTIEEMLEDARESKGKSLVKWAEDGSHPVVISIDPLPEAMDDEITYTVVEFEEL